MVCAVCLGACDQIIEISDHQTALTLVAENTGNEPIEVDYVVGLRTDADADVEHQARNSFVVVNTINQEPVVITPENTETFTVPVSETPIVYTSDLVVKPIGVGYLNNQRHFIPSQTIDRNERGALKFSVHNVGNLSLIHISEPTRPY